MHHPVFLTEIIDNLKVKERGLYIDATFGEGGDSLAILKKGGQVLGIEWDKNQYQAGKMKYKKYIDAGKLKLVNSNFAKIKQIAQRNDFFPVDGVVFDLGLSMRQLKESGRGFSFKKENEPLDMRINFKLKVTAADLINSLSKEELYEIFAKYSEEIHSLRLVENIIRTRTVKKIERVKDLLEVIDKTLGKKDERVYRRIFQGLRIAVNNELENLKKGLEGAVALLNKSGRIIVVTFHSLEDRLVKNFVKDRHLFLFAKKPFVGRIFNYERSAKLRVISLR